MSADLAASSGLPDLPPVGPPLGPAHQEIADGICSRLRLGQPQAPLLRGCAERAVGDLRYSISLESMPEMATRLTLVRLAGLAGAGTAQYRAELTPLLRLIPPTDVDASP